jgi:Ca2+-binding RTX toxin-like protein
VTGYTSSSDFPTTAGALDTSYNGNRDAYVTKLNAGGSALSYSTYLGGANGEDRGRGVAVDSTGNAYIAGLTGSSDFPVKAGAFDTSYNGGASDAYLTRLNSTGAAIADSTYLGGSGDDDALGLTLDASKNAYVTGTTTSSNFPVTAGAYDTTFSGTSDAFVTKVPAPPTCNGKPATIVGTGAGETLTGTSGNDVIAGLGGNDTISGAGGNDTICGGDGADKLDGGSGADFLSGQAGIDIVTYGTRSTAVTVDIDNVADDGNSSDGPAGARDNVRADVESLIGGSGADALTGSTANNRLTGGPGADSLAGLGGNDILFANDGTADSAIDCDGGTADTAHVDSQDPTPVGCETIGT